MALKPIGPPPDTNTGITEPGRVGVFWAWHEWFTRLWRFVNDLYALVVSIQNNSNNVTSDGGMVPYYIPAAETFEVPVYKQGLFKETILVDGVLLVNGILLGVD